MEILLIFYAYFLTIVNEIAFMSLVNNKLKKDDLIYFFVVNSVTNIFAQLISLLVFYFIPTLNYFILFIPLEGVVVLAEIFLYQIKYRNIKLSLLSILGNLFTIGISLIFYFFGSNQAISYLISGLATLLFVFILFIYRILMNRYGKIKKTSNWWNFYN